MMVFDGDAPPIVLKDPPSIGLANRRSCIWCPPAGAAAFPGIISPWVTSARRCFGDVPGAESSFWVFPDLFMVNSELYL